MEAEGGHVGFAPSVDALLDVFLILDPTSGFLPFAFVRFGVEFVEFDEDLRG